MKDAATAEEPPSLDDVAKFAGVALCVAADAGASEVVIDHLLAALRALADHGRVDVISSRVLRQSSLDRR